MSLRQFMSGPFGKTVQSIALCTLGVLSMRMAWILFEISPSTETEVDWIKEISASGSFASGLYLVVTTLAAEMRDLGVLPRFGIDLFVCQGAEAAHNASNIHEGHA